jgi:two-component sensor histidine kinase
MVKHPFKWVWAQVAVLLLGILSVVFLFINFLNNEMVLQDTMRTDILMDSVNEATMAQVLLMDYLNVDTSTDVKAALSAFGKSVGKMEMLLEGGEFSEGFEIEPLYDRGFRATAGDMKSQLVKIKASAVEVIKKSDGAEDIIPLERRLKGLFIGFIEQAGELEDRLDMRQVEKERQAERIFWKILAVWSSLVIITVAWLWKLELVRSRDELKIRKALDEKETLLMEIHHRVKNNLTVVQSLLKLQASRVQDDDARIHYRESRNRIKSMSMIHERLSRSENLSNISFSEYVSSLATQLLKSYEDIASNVTLDINVPDVRLDVDTVIPCGLMVNELVSNVLKHAFPDGREGGELLIKLAPGEDSAYTLTVRDNGIGIPGGMDIHNTETLGLHLVTRLTGQLGGGIELIRDGGTEFRITFREKRFR